MTDKSTGKPKNRSGGRKIASSSARGVLRSGWFAPAVVVGLALALRLIYVYQIRHTPFFQTLGLDARFYDQWARTLAGGEGYGQPFFMSPLYPYFLTGLYRLFDRNLFVVRLVQSAMGAVSAGLVYLLAKDLFDRRVAALAGVGAACYGALIFYDGSIVMTPLLVFLSLLSLFLLVRADGTRNRLMFAAAGAALGLAGIGRASALVFVPLAMWWIASRPPSERSMKAERTAARSRGSRRARGARAGQFGTVGIFVAGILVVMAPVTIRNSVVSRDFIPVTSNGGLNFYIGNGAVATGGYARPEGLDIVRDPGGASIAERDLGRELTPSEVSSYWYSRARRDIGRDPGRWLSLMIRKLSFVLSSYEFPQLENYEFQRRYSRLLSMPLPGFGVVAPLGLLGLALMLRRRRSRVLALFFSAYTASIVAFFVLARYRLPAVPVLLIGASYVIVEAYDRLRAGGTRRLLWLVPAVAALAVLVNANFYSVDRRKPFAQIHYRLGLIYGDRGDLDRALGEYGLAIEIDPEYPRSYLNMGALLAEAGRLEEAAGAFERAVEVDPDYVAARVNLAMVHIQRGSIEDALGELRVAVAQDPGSAMAHTQIGVALYKAGRADEALSAFADAERLDAEGTERAEIEFYKALIERPAAAPVPEEVSRAIVRADSLIQVGRAAEAVEVLREAASRAPESGVPLQQLALLERSLGLLDEAVADLREALRVQPGIRHGHFMLGVFLNESGQHEAAILEYQAELRVDPGYAPAHRNLATSYLYHLANRNRASQHYREYLRLGGEPVPPLSEALSDAGTADR